MPGSEIRVLFATDIVSEGQNLQDCARILNYDLHWNPVRLIQRFGRVDRIGTEHEIIDLHNTWPDTAVDEGLNLTDRLHNRIQSFHDLIGLDSKLLSEAERLNGKEMYNIYVDGKLPESDDGLDDVAANQRAIALLQRIQDDDPGLWDTITNLPDGIRSALQAKSGAAGSAYSIDGAQFSLEIHGSQMPLMSPSSATGAPSPFDEPRAGETLVLLRQGDFRGCYAVSVDGEGNPRPRPISPAQFIAAAECIPDHTCTAFAGRHQRARDGGVRRVSRRRVEAPGARGKTPRQPQPALHFQAAQHRPKPLRTDGTRHLSTPCARYFWATCPPR